MSHSLTIRPAGPDETAQAHANVFGHWSKAKTLDEHVSFLLNSSPFRRAEWFVGFQGNRVVTSLGAYPFEFQMQGEVLPGIAIGSVFTVSDCRRQGLAAKLFEWVEQHFASRHTALSLLYSDIDPDYYGRLGYVACPSHEGWLELKMAGSAPAGGAARLVRFDPHEHRPALARSYARYHDQRPLCVARNDEYWSAMFEKSPGDEFYWLSTAEKEQAGYVRIRVADKVCKLRDYALDDSNPETAEALYKALIALARERGLERCGGWLPDNQAAHSCFKIEPRRIEITMIKPLDWKGELTDAMISAADDFCEIDHV